MNTVIVTLFADVTAQTKREQAMTMTELAWHARVTNAPAKERLPLWKLARFGNARTPLGSLRHDANVIAGTGIEADYDGEQLNFDAAVEIAEKAGLAALIYTSPSHAPQKPRWRVLCPAERDFLPDRRPHLMDRLNGLYRGIFARESWTLSQAYYFGSVAANPAHRVEWVDGTPIDRLDELDAISRGPRGASTGAAPGASAEARDDAELIRCIATGEHFHVELCALAARYIGRGLDRSSVSAILQGLLLALPESARDARWHDRYRSIDGIVASAAAKFSGGAEGRRAIARLTHQLVRRHRSGEEIKAAILSEAERRGIDAACALAIGGAILRDKMGGGRRHA